MFTDRTELVGLINNVALLLALGLLYDVIPLRRRLRMISVMQVVTGLLLGGIGLAVMLNPWEFFTEGVIFDTRSILLSIAGLFFGVVPTMIAVMMTAALRIFQGGAGAFTGVGVIATSGLIGIGWRHLRRGGLETISLKELYLFGLVVHVNMLLWMLTLPDDLAFSVLERISLPVLVIYPVGTMLAGWVIIGRLRRRRMEETLRVTLTSIKEGVITADVNGDVVFMNPIAEELTGWVEAEAKERPLTEVFRTKFLGDGQETEVAEGKILMVLDEVRQCLLTARDGREYTIEGIASVIMDAEAGFEGMAVVFRDVSEKLLLEKEMLKIRKLESIGLLAGGIAHDFNNLLTGLFGHVALAKRKLDEGHPAYKHVSVAERALEKTTGLTQQLLTFAKGGEPIKQAEKIEEVVRETAEFMLAGSNVKLHLEVADDLRQIEADKGQISQVVSNLVTNSMQAMGNGGNLTIGLKNYEHVDQTRSILASGRYVEMTICDEGGGIMADDLERVFDPYFTTKTEGNGLGLAMVHSIVRRHGGHITVESAEGEGTVFRVYLPVARQTAEVVHEDGAMDGAGGKGECVEETDILVMDDDETVRHFVQTVLEQCGHRVTAVGDGRAAIEAYVKGLEAERPFGLVIMDLTVSGGMGGQQAAAEILKVDPAAKLIVSSGYSTDPVLAHYEVYGFVGRVNKPYLPETLYAVIDEVLSKYEV